MEVEISGWGNPRQVWVEDNTLYMEVARQTCKDCKTCADRIQTVVSRLAESNTEWRFHSREGGMYIAVELKHEPTSIAEFLSELLGLEIMEA